MTLTVIIFTLVNIVLAFIDAHKIIKDKWINHALNGLLYLAILVVPYFLLRNYYLIAALLFNRLIFFNIALSLFRFGWAKWDYISPAPTAITDRIAKFIFGNRGKLMYLVYSIIFIALLIIIYV